MWFNLAFEGLKYSIRSYGTARLYRDIRRLAKQRIKNEQQCYHSLETVKFFLRDKKVTPIQVMKNKNIQFLVKQCHQDLQKHPILSVISEKLISK